MVKLLRGCSSLFETLRINKPVMYTLWNKWRDIDLRGVLSCNVCWFLNLKLPNFGEKIVDLYKLDFFLDFFVIVTLSVGFCSVHINRWKGCFLSAWNSTHSQCVSEWFLFYHFSEIPFGSLSQDCQPYGGEKLLHMQINNYETNICFFITTHLQ